jgi:hypothetical protein
MRLAEKLERVKDQEKRREPEKHNVGRGPT